jgi:hypothetical protein
MSCFEPYQGISPLSEKLRGSFIPPNSGILNCATIGLKFVFQKISTRVHNKALHNIVGGRYRLEAEIARGTFSSVFSGEDLHKSESKKNVALKIVNTGCEVLANREKVILDHINYGLERPLCKRFCNLVESILLSLLFYLSYGL